MIKLDDLREAVRRLMLEAMVRPLVADAMTEGWSPEEVTAAVEAEVARFPGEGSAL